MTDSTFNYLATVSASTKRADLTSGYSTELVGLKCWPLAPVDADTRQRLDLKSPHTLKETFLEGGLDIRKGDKLVVGDVEYPIKAVETWPWQMSGIRLRVIVEDMRNN